MRASWRPSPVTRWVERCSQCTAEIFSLVSSGNMDKQFDSSFKRMNYTRILIIASCWCSNKATRNCSSVVNFEPVVNMDRLKCRAHPFYLQFYECVSLVCTRLGYNRAIDAAFFLALFSASCLRTTSGMEFIKPPHDWQSAESSIRHPASSHLCCRQYFTQRAMSGICSQQDAPRNHERWRRCQDEQKCVCSICMLSQTKHQINVIPNFRLQMKVEIVYATVVTVRRC